MPVIELKKFSLSPNKLSLYNVYERVAGDDDFTRWQTHRFICKNVC